MAQVKFYKGTLASYNSKWGKNGTPELTGAIWFTTDTNEIILNNVHYGLSSDDKTALNGAIGTVEFISPDTIKFTNVAGTLEKAITLPKASSTVDGLMSAADKASLDTLNGDVNIAGSVKKQISDAKAEVVGNDSDETTSDTIKGVRKHANALNTAMDTRVKGLETKMGSTSVSDQITAAISSLDKADTAIDGQYVSEVSEADGIINVKRVALPELAEVGGTGKVITTVSQTKGALAATAIDLKAANVAATATLASDTAVAVTGNNVEAQIASLAASIKTTASAAKSYRIAAISGEELAALGTNVKEAYKLVDEDGVQAGSAIKIYKDSSLKSVALDGQTLNFTYILADGSENTVGVDVSNFLAESEFGKGLEVVNHIVNVKVDAASENFLTVGANGVKLSGVQNAINAAKTELIGGAADGYNTLGKLEDKIKEVDTKVSSAHTVVNAKADGHVIVTVAKSEDSTHDVVTVTENDIASATNLTNEIAHRKAVTGIKGDAYVKHTEDTIIGTATDLDDADVKLATKLKAVSDDVDTIKGDKTFVKSLAVNNVPADIANNAATVTIDGADIKLSGYTAASDGGKLTPEDTINAALGKIEYMLTWHEAN